MQASKCNLPNGVMSVCSNGLHSSGRELGTQATQSGTAGNQVPPRNPQVTGQCHRAKHWCWTPGSFLTHPTVRRTLKDTLRCSEADSADCGRGQVACFLYLWTLYWWELRKGDVGDIEPKQCASCLGLALKKKKATVQKCLKATKEYWIGTG